MWRRIVPIVLVLVASTTGAAARATAAGTPEVPELPVLHAAVAPGHITRTPAGTTAPATHQVDGQIGDWIGTPTRLAGTAAYSAGEYVYSDHLFDAYGADAGNDAQRMQYLDPLATILPETYRLDPVGQINPFDEIGIPLDWPLAASETYGDSPFAPAADIQEVRVAATADTVNLLVRTTTMTAPNQTAVLVLADTDPVPAGHAVPFGTGLSTTRADVAALLVGSTATVVDLRTGAPLATTTQVATNPAGYDNAVEASFPRSLLQSSDGRFHLAVATGLAGANATTRIANVAFRPDEPVTTWFDKQQALALGAGSIDAFFATVDPTLSQAGTNDRVTMQPGGYFERVFPSSPAISSEGGMDGVLQPYGLYVPRAYDGSVTRRAATFWMHWRGGKTHSGAAVSPRIMRDEGDTHGGFVFAPRGRGSSSWYLGKGMVDFNEVWADAMASFPVDPDRVYVSGHSMGGWASWLLAILYPDRFAGAFPVEGPLTQGAWTGLDFPGCDGYFFPQEPDYTPCYVATNDSNPRVQATLRLIGNLRNVPMAIYQGVIDELVPVSGVTLQVDKLRSLGLQYHYYLFPTYEHYTHPIVDEWAEGARYLDGFRRPANPAQVTYTRDMPFERTVETGPSQVHPTTGLNFDFDHAYWMSELTPVDPVAGVASVDAHSFAIASPPTKLLPEAGGPTSPGQAGPYVMTGQRLVDNPLAKPSAPTNAFSAVVLGSQRVAFDLSRMSISTGSRIFGGIATDRAIEVRLAGPWTSVPPVQVNGAPLTAALDGGALVLHVPVGTNVLTIG